MSAQPAGPPPGRRPGKASLFAVTACKGCGNTVLEVRTLPRDGGHLMRLDGRDPDGEWWATRVSGRWYVTQPPDGTAPPAGDWRYAGHRCPSVVIRTDVGVSRPGPCAGGCGGRSHRLYGWNADPLCVLCRQVLEEWRGDPGRVGPIPYGRWVAGHYTNPSGCAPSNKRVT